MLTILILGGDPEKVKASQRARFADETIVDQIQALDGQRRTGKYPALSSWSVGIELRHDNAN